MYDPIDVSLRVYSHCDDDDGWWIRFHTLAHFISVTNRALGDWQGVDSDVQFGEWEWERRNKIINALCEATEFLEVAKFEAGNAGWQLIPTELLKNLSYPDLEAGVVPSRNYLLRQQAGIELIEGWTVYVDAVFANEAFAALTEGMDLSPKLPSGLRLATSDDYKTAYIEHYVKPTLARSLVRPRVASRIQWIRDNLGLKRDRARELEKSAKPPEWYGTGRRPNQTA